MNPVTIIILICMVIIFILAIYWEAKDMLRVSKLPNVYDIKDPKKKEDAYIFFSTFPYENTVTWRHIYIGATVSAILIYYILLASKNKISIEIGLGVFFIIFFTYYYIDNFRSFHLWRVLDSKVKKATIL